ncbi:GH92 family glycosyl hydrolase [Actinoplanes sp. NPDC049118]|uniref:GH92 family glycosyl hydrolase n=1 Tax=Actinoplanes sp. NPDC049118 TaxID=3155769 RepID=UPI00340EB141
MSPLPRRTVLSGAAAAVAAGTTSPLFSGITRQAAAGVVPTTPEAEVDPLIGVDNGGEIVPGAYVPFGFAKPSPDCVSIPGGESPTSGYRSNRDIRGFSQTHVSGTGGASKYGNFRITPRAGSISTVKPATDIAQGSAKRDERAAPGYYGVTLTRDGGIRAELTATRMCAVHKYTFPVDKSGILLIDASSVIETQNGQQPLTCEVTIVGDRRIEIIGRFRGGWNPGEYTLYAVLEFNRPFVGYGTWAQDTVTERSRRLARAGWHTGAYATFDTKTQRDVEVRIGLSWRDLARAGQNLRSQLGSDDFAAVARRGRQIWAENLARIEVDGGSAAERTCFYSALLHAQAMPHDLTGENIWWDSPRAHYEDFYTLWDTFRTVNPLLTLIQPRRQADLVQSLVETFTRTGWMPDARIAGHNGYTQGGTNGDVIVADALLKQLPDIDYATAYRALRKNADVESDDALKQGRQLADYKKLGYLPVDQSGPTMWWSGRSASRTLEYSYNDFCIAAVAWRHGDNEKAMLDWVRAESWKKLWDKENRVIRPRYVDGTWLADFDKDRAYRGWSDPFYEGTARQYSTYVPHDVQGVINRTGGDSGFVAWLDELFDGGHYNPGNEPDLLAGYLYIHAGRHDRTAERVRSLLSTKYSIDRDGLPENDDAGTLSAWYVWGALGLFPNAGQDWYYIGSPVFAQSRIKVSGGTLTIQADGVSAAAKYVQSATLHGRPLHRAWLRHSDIVGGGTLWLTMGQSPSGWARQADARPPSMSQPY